MKLCQRHGNGVCINCNHLPTKDMGDICRYEAEDWVNALAELLHTKLSDEQREVLRDFGIIFFDKTE